VQATAIEAENWQRSRRQPRDGCHIPVDLVVVGVGVLPNVELAGGSGPAGRLGHQSSTSIC